MKSIKFALIKSLTLITTQLNTGIFPDKLKMSKVIPIFKKDDKTLFSNYIPISTLPVISKIIKKVIYNQIYSLFNEHKLFDAYQCGFRSEHSTELAALEIIDRTITNIDNIETPKNIF